MAPDRRNVSLTTILILACAAAVANAAVIDVPGSQPTLAAALAAARAGDVIELAPGRYAERGLVIRAAVTIRGLGGDPAGVVLDGTGGGRILSCEDVPGEVVLQNLTLRAGLAAGSTSRLRSGGAVYVARSRLVAQNCRFENNSAAAHGGAIRFVAAGGRLSQCVFTGNRALLGGGAVDCSYNSSPVIDRCNFSANEGGWGGAVSCRSYSSPVIGRSIFVANATSGLFGYGGGVFADLDSSPELSLCTFTQNSAAYGGALGCFQGSRVAVDRCTVSANIATGAGAGIYCIDGSPRVTASIVAFQSGSGVESVGLSLPELGCSSIYGNSGSDVNGPVTGVPGAGPVTSTDPRFCWTAPTTSGVLTIAPDSPLAGGSCGTMGAWPAVCSLGPAAVATFIPDATAGRTTVRWWTTGDHPGADYRLTWSRPGEPEREILVTQTGENAFTAVSTEPPAGDGSVVFRLYTTALDGGWLLAADSGFSTGGGDGDGEGELPPPADHLAVRNWPNPFNPETTIAVVVRRTERVRVDIYGLDGRRVRRLADRVFAAGEEELRWDGRDEGGRALSSGSYLVRVESRSEARSLKVTLLK